MSEFTWEPIYGDSDTTEFSVRETEFGDGYVQSVAETVNNEMFKATYTFEYPPAEIENIVQFLKLRRGATKFTFTPPGGTEISVVCKKYTKRYSNYGLYRLTCEFERRYG